MSQRSIRGWTPVPVPGEPKVSVAIATFEQGDELACLLYSLKAQTYANWEAVVVHDGPGVVARQVVEKIGDARIRLIETPTRKGEYGHPWRELGIDACTGDYIGLTNGDNYYVPVYFEWMLHVLTTTAAELVYCDLVHSHAQWACVRSAPVRGLIDVGSWIAAAGLVKTTPWRDYGFAGDGTFFEEMKRRARVVKYIDRPLFVHN